jgi:ferredoxin-nitrite reductase
MNTTLPEPPTTGFTTEQKEYLTGLFAGAAARGKSFADVEPAPAPQEDLIVEERIKRELHPLDAYPQLLENAATNQAPDKEDTFRFKWNGLFYLAPNKPAFMTRLRIPGGVVKSYQLRELAHIAKELTSGYVQITTRANLQLRLIEPKNAPDVISRIQAIGLHTRGSGADNIRNLTANPTAGIDPVELIDVMPLLQQLAQIIINDRAFYDLPRKFNIAYDGGGLIGAVEDTNDIGVKAVLVGATVSSPASSSDHPQRADSGIGAPDVLPPAVYFRIALGGATGHKTFARDLGVVISPAEINKVVAALVRVFIERGCRTDRKRARLKHLLEKMSLEEFLAHTETKLGKKLTRAPYDPATMRWASQELPHSHVGDFPQKQRGLNYVGATVTVGEITPKQMIRIAEIADLYGSGEIRLTVWQNFIIPNIPDAYVETVKKALRKVGFETTQSNLRSGLIACTGNSYCKFAQANTKGTARAIADHLEKKLSLDTPINIHLTGCPNSCAQHYMGDIGLLATKVKGEEAYHILVGGGFGGNQAVGRQVFTGVLISELPLLLEKMLRVYLNRRQGRETLQQFTARHDLNTLQAIFSNNE